MEMMFCEGPCTLSKSIAMSTKMFRNGQSFNVGGCLLHVLFISHHDTKEDQISSKSLDVHTCTCAQLEVHKWYRIFFCFKNKYGNLKWTAKNGSPQNNSEWWQFLPCRLLTAHGCTEWKVWSVEVKSKSVFKLQC